MSKTHNRGDPQETSPRTSRKSLAILALGIVVLAAGLVGVLLIGLLERPVRVDKILAAYKEGGQYGGLTIHYPHDQTLFPPEIVAPTFRWEDDHVGSGTWLVTMDFQDDEGRISLPCSGPEWTPSDDQWESIKRRSLEKITKVTVLGVNRAEPERILSAASISISTSKDKVGAPHLLPGSDPALD